MPPRYHTSPLAFALLRSPLSSRVANSFQPEQQQQGGGWMRHRALHVSRTTPNDETPPLDKNSEDQFSNLVDVNEVDRSLSNQAEVSPKHEQHFRGESFWFSLSKGLPTEAVLALNGVAIIWGTQHPVIKMVVNDCDPSAFSLVRFFLGAVIATPAFLASIRRPQQQEEEENGDNEVEPYSPSKTWRWGAEMGLWMFLGYACQAIGLAFTTAQRSGFLLYLNVKFVPFFAFVLFGRKISTATWLSALTALVGTGLLTYDGGSLDLNVGDLWSIGAAAASAMYILRLESASKEVPNSAALNAACLWTVTGAAFVWSLVRSAVTADASFVNNIMMTISTHPWAVVYLGGITTALANFIQTKAQRNVTAERASVIYAMDPVYGSIFSYLLLGETLNNLGLVGAGLITLAAATNAFLDLGSREKTVEEASN